MDLPTKTRKQYVNDALARWAAEVGIEPNFPKGDALLALAQAIASNLMYVQYLLKLVNKLTRASTSFGADLDTWMADFGFERLPAQAASGIATFSVLSPRTQQTLIPAGSVVQVTGGAIKYQVIADTTNPAWYPNLNAYVLAANTTSVDVRVQSTDVGAAQNIQPNTLVQMYSTISGIDNVTNANPISNGWDAEPDDSLRARFILWFANKDGGTVGALLAAALGVQQGLDVSIVENLQPNGSPQAAYVCIVVDDGSGSPPDTLVNAVFAACDKVRAAGIQIVVTKPSELSVNIELSVRVKPAANVAPVLGNVQTAILDFVNTLKIGQELYLNELVVVAAQADPNVVAIEPLSVEVAINGGSMQAVDVTTTEFQIVRTTLAHITVGTY